jgi:hypothetical protein
MVQFSGLVRDSSGMPKTASVWLECRSLLAGDAERPTPVDALNRLQAGSYKKRMSGTVD